MIDILHKLGLPINMSVQGAAIDEINAIVHWLMLVLFVGWGLFFIVSLIKFRASKNAKAELLLDSLLIYYPKDLDLLFTRANTQFSNQDWTQLLKTYQHIFESDTDQDELLIKIYEK